ncbi:hypothetical protein B7463_g9258, partial [Scytalidium lignicola]
MVVGEADDDQVNVWMDPFVQGGKDWLGRCRNLARFWCWTEANLAGWKGRELMLYLILVESGSERPLRDLFQPVFPAGVGEFVSALCSEVYWKDLAESTRLPCVVETVIVVVKGYVKYEIVCCALGYSGSLPNVFDSLSLSLCTSSKAEMLLDQTKGYPITEVAAKSKIQEYQKTLEIEHNGESFAPGDM